MKESKRIKIFRGEIITALPKFPNTRATKENLEKMPLATLLIHYLNWMSRYISIKPRKTTIEPAVTADRRWKLLKEPIRSFLEKVRIGENLTPHLSIQPHSKGYSPATSEQGPDVDRWADKDFLLNAMGFHHFHLGTVLEDKGHVNRTNDVLFARVTREEFTASGIFDHSVFGLAGEEMSAERKRLWTIFDMHTSRGAPPGSFVIASPIATSGHPIHVVATAQEYSRIIRELDPKLDNPEFAKELYGGTNWESPLSIKLEWALNFTDLCIHEKHHSHLFLLRRGFN
jgi:hypothetical protein